MNSLATFKKRFLAYIIDDTLMGLIFFAVFFEVLTSGRFDFEGALAFTNQYLFEILFIKFVYHTFFVWYYGATLGKIICKIRVVYAEDYAQVSFGSAVIRSFGRLLSDIVFYIGFIVALFTQNKQTFHDKLAKTLVIDV